MVQTVSESIAPLSFNRPRPNPPPSLPPLPLWPPILGKSARADACRAGDDARGSAPAVAATAARVAGAALRQVAVERVGDDGLRGTDRESKEDILTNPNGTADTDTAIRPGTPDRQTETSVQVQLQPKKRTLDRALDGEARGALVEVHQEPAKRGGRPRMRPGGRCWSHFWRTAASALKRPSSPLSHNSLGPCRCTVDVLDARGSTANNVLVGGSGKNNTVYGGLGRDLLIADLAAATLCTNRKAQDSGVLRDGWFAQAAAACRA